MANLIGTAPDQVSVNGMLGKAAFMDSDVPFNGALVAIQPAPTITAATTIAPTNLIQFVTGSGTITTITPPTNMLVTGGQITLIPNVASTWVTSNTVNIALATTAVVGKALIMTYDSFTGKWYPSY